MAGQPPPPVFNPAPVREHAVGVRVGNEEVFGEFTRAWLMFFMLLQDQIGHSLEQIEILGGQDIFRGTALLEGIQAVGTNKLNPEYVVQLPAGYKAVLSRGFASSIVNPATTSFIMNFTVNTDNRATATYTPIMTSGITIAVAASRGQSAALDITELFDGDIIQVNVTQADGTVAGVDAVLLGTVEPI